MVGKGEKMFMLLLGVHQVVLLCVVDAGSENTPVHERGWLCLAPQCCTTPRPAILQLVNLGDIEFVSCDVTCDEAPIPKMQYKEL